MRVVRWFGIAVVAAVLVGALASPTSANPTRSSVPATAAEDRVVRGYFTEVLGHDPSAAELSAWRTELRAADFAARVRPADHAHQHVQASVHRGGVPAVHRQAAGAGRHGVLAAAGVSTPARARHDFVAAAIVGSQSFVTQANPDGSSSANSTPVIRATYPGAHR